MLQVATTSLWLHCHPLLVRKLLLTYPKIAFRQMYRQPCANKIGLMILKVGGVQLFSGQGKWLCLSSNCLHCHVSTNLKYFDFKLGCPTLCNSLAYNSCPLTSFLGACVPRHYYPLFGGTLTEFWFCMLLMDPYMYILRTWESNTNWNSNFLALHTWKPFVPLDWLAVVAMIKTAIKWFTVQLALTAPCLLFRTRTRLWGHLWV